MLAEVARGSPATMRSEDVLARLGGEEFACLLPSTGAQAAWRAAERAREAVESEPFAEVGRITVSAGVCDLSLRRMDGRTPASRRRRALLGQDPRPQRRLPLLAGGNGHPVRRGPGRPGGAGSGRSRRSPRSPGRSTRRTRRRSATPSEWGRSRARSRGRWAGRRSVGPSSTRPASCTTSGRSACRTASCGRPAR